MGYLTIKNSTLKTEARVVVSQEGVIGRGSVRTAKDRLKTPPGAGGPLGEVPLDQFPIEHPGVRYRFHSRADGTVFAEPQSDAPPLAALEEAVARG